MILIPQNKDCLLDIKLEKTTKKPVDIIVYKLLVQSVRSKTLVPIYINCCTTVNS